MWFKIMLTFKRTFRAEPKWTTEVSAISREMWALSGNTVPINLYGSMFSLNARIGAPF
jgi:hypothetical protein